MSTGQKKAPTARGDGGSTQGHARTGTVYRQNEQGSSLRGVDNAKIIEASVTASKLNRILDDMGLTGEERDSFVRTHFLIRPIDISASRKAGPVHPTSPPVPAEECPAPRKRTPEEQERHKAEIAARPASERNHGALRATLNKVLVARQRAAGASYRIGDEDMLRLALRLDKAAGGNVEGRMRRTASARSCGWLSRAERDAIIAEILAEPDQRFDGWRVGRLIGLTAAERNALPEQYRSIMPCDLSPEEHAREKHEKRLASRRAAYALKNGRKRKKGPTVAETAAANGCSVRTVYSRKATGQLLQNFDGQPPVITLRKRGRKTKSCRQ